MGIRDDLVRDIMTPGFEQIRQRDSAWGWIKCAIDLRWDCLMWYKRISEDRDNQVAGRTTPVRVNALFKYDVGAGKAIPTDGEVPGTLTLYKGTSRSQVSCIHTVR